MKRNLPKRSKRAIDRGASPLRIDPWAKFRESMVLGLPQSAKAATLSGEGNAVPLGIAENLHLQIGEYLLGHHRSSYWIAIYDDHFTEAVEAHQPVPCPRCFSEFMEMKSFDDQTGRVPMHYTDLLGARHFACGRCRLSFEVPLPV